MGKQNKKEEYKRMIVEISRMIEDLEGLKMIYGMIRAVHRNSKKAEED